MGTVTLVHDCDIERLDDPDAANGPFQDAYIAEDNADTNYGEATEMFAWWSISEKITYELRSPVVFDLNYFLPADAVITAAVWHFYVTQANMPDAAMDIRARRTTDATEIVEDEVTWNVPAVGETWGAEHGTTDPTISLGRFTTTGWYTHDFKTLVDDAWDNRGGILGFILLRIDGVSGTAGGIAVAQKAYPYESQPYCHHLRITYTLDGRTFQALLR